MGVGFLRSQSSSSFDKKSVSIFSRKSSSSFESNLSSPKEPIQEGNPDPFKYEIIRTLKIKHFLIIKINYPDCKNYEGNKILVFDNCSLEDIIKQKAIDPHFSDNKQFKSPIARFEPTDRGWNMAEYLCKY